MRLSDAQVDLALGGLAIVGVSAAWTPDAGVLRVVALPLVVFLPGLALVRSLRLNLTGVAKVTLACGLSLALAALTGLPLNLLRALSVTGWALALGGITLALTVVSLIRAHRPSGDSPRWQAPPLMQSVLVGLGCCAVLAAFVVARDGALAQREFNFTEFWMASHGINAPGVVTLGVHNEEAAESSYRIELVADGAVVDRDLFGVVRGRRRGRALDD